MNPFHYVRASDAAVGHPRAGGAGAATRSSSPAAPTWSI